MKKLKELQEKLNVIEAKADKVEKRLDAIEGKGIPDKQIMFPDVDEHRWG